jgi:NAD(P)-dependent dehydrogenase (short-subunit alcohol dehydrogenase family)
MIFNRVLHLFVFVILNIASFSLFAIDVNNQNTVLIIGGAKNIGKEIATEFAKAGWDVWVTSRDVSEKYRYEISRYKIRALKLDITNHDQVKKNCR